MAILDILSQHLENLFRVSLFSESLLRASPETYYEHPGEPLLCTPQSVVAISENPYEYLT